MMAERMKGIKRYTPAVETVVHELDEIPEDMTEEILKTLNECEDLAAKKNKKRVGGLAGLLSRLKR